MTIRKPTAAIIASFAALSSLPAKADALTDAMKRIAELEAKNIALEVNQRRLEQENSAITESKIKLEQSLKQKEALPIKHDVAAEKKNEKVATLSSHKAAAPVQPIQQDTKNAEEITKLAFEGAYIGINGGYGGGDILSNTAPLLYQPSNTFVNTVYTTSVTRYGGALAGGQIGYNFALGKSFILGAEYDFDWADISAKSSSGSSQLTNNGFTSQYNGSQRTGINWISTVRLQFGYVVKDFMPYLTGGFAFGEARGNGNSYQASLGTGTTSAWSQSLYNSSRIMPGWAVGAGLEYKLIKDLSFKTEYLYTQLSPLHLSEIALFGFSSGGNSAALVSGTTGNLGFHQVRFGVNYHPNWFNAPAVVAAKY